MCVILRGNGMFGLEWNLDLDIGTEQNRSRDRRDKTKQSKSRLKSET
jgi:hypothetical protein